MTLGMAFFLLNDATIKLLSESLQAQHVIFLRGVLATTLILAIAGAAGFLRPAMLLRVAERNVGLRALCDLGGTFLLFTALANLPLPNVTAINMSAPMITTALAVPFFGERVGLPRWLAIGSGFLGVLLIVRPVPGSVDDAYGLVALGATLFHAFRDLATRGIGGGVPSLLVTAVTSASVTIAGGALTATTGLPALGAREWLLVGLAGIFVVGGYYFMVVAVRAAPLSEVAPFRYTGVLWSILLGALLWGDFPDAVALVGVAVIVGSGLYILRPQRGTLAP